MPVSVQHISKKFGNVSAVDDVSFEVKDGEFLVLLGPSGSGKTTTLRCIAGLESVDTGRISIDGRDVTELPPGQRDVAMVFQNYALYPYMTVYENIAFPLKVKKFAKEEIDRRVNRVADFLRIKHLLARKPKQLSGGEQQRVALGRAIIREPKVFLMDEPLSNLDAKLRVYMRAELKKLQRELGIKTVYVTHDQAEAMTMADRIAVFNSGRIQQIETPLELYRRPVNSFVAGFIGAPSMNLISCGLTMDGEDVIAETSLFRYRLGKELAEAVKKEKLHGEVILGIRPEDIRMVSPGTEGSFEAKVFIVEPLGSETVVDVTSDETLIKIKVQGSFKANSGDTIALLFADDAVHIFDKETGRNILLAS